MILKPAALLAAIVTLIFAGSVLAADPVNIEIMAVEEEPGRMVLTVSAVDENGKPFPGLDRSSFNAWINDTALIVKELHTATDRQPASVLLLVDVSGSMSGEPIQQAQAAIGEFIDVLEPNDEVALMAFSSGVNLVQDFTSDRTLLDNAVASFTLTNDTALYDGVIQAAAKMTEVPRSRKLIVLLSDGLANINQGQRDASIEAARDAGVGFIAVSLGASTDRDYLTELASASGGDLIEAANPGDLRQAYTGLAFAIRSQYTLVTEVPRSIDRTVAGTLKVHVIHRADNAFAERALEPLEGAVPPPFTMALDGISAGDKHNGSIEIVPTVQEGIEVVKVDYILDDEVIHTSDGVGNYTLDASLLANGSHVLKVVATDIEGREGEVQVPFLVPVLVVPAEGKSLPIVPIMILVVLLALAYLVFKVGRKRWRDISTPTYSRINNWTSIRTMGGGQKPEDWTEGDPEPVRMPIPLTPPSEIVQGRVVIMDEAAVRGGELETIREFEMKSLPLTFGSGPNADMRVGDAGGMIAAEEARVWIQRGRLVYHKLTTLSAMATEGVTAGWQFLNDGDEMRIGPYRLIFQAQQPEEADDDSNPEPSRLPQEHGMALHRSFGLTDSDRNPNLQEWAADQGPASSEEQAAPSIQHLMGDQAEPEAAAEEPAAQPQWGDWDQPDFPAPASSTEPAPSSWSIESEDSPASGWGDAAEEPDSAGRDVDAATDTGASTDGETPSQPAGWESLPTLEPKSADWLVEQSQPVDDGIAPIIPTDGWSGFVSEPEAEGADAPQGEEDEYQDDDRAWGT